MTIPISDFQFYFPTRFLFGNGRFDSAGKEIAQLGRKAMIVTTNGASMREHARDLRRQLGACGVESVLFDQIEANPTHTMVNEGGALARSEGVDVVVGLGGGSPMDAAKGIAVVATEKIDIWKIVEGAPITQPSLPIVAIPSTAGTGSEVTQFTVISHHELKRKEGFARQQFYPSLSIIDPELTASMPPDITAQTGLDALSHALESYTCRVATPVTDQYAEAAIRLVGQYLRRAVFNGKDMEARSNMMLASTLAGMAITQSDTAMAHVIGEATGAIYNTGHGLSVAICLPAVMEFNSIASLEKYACVAELLGLDPVGLSLRERAMLAADLVRELLIDVGLPRGLAAIGVDDTTGILKLASRPGMDATNPRPASFQDLEALVKGCVAPEMSYWKYAS